MSEEPARPEEVVGGGEGEAAQPQADQPNEPTETAAVPNAEPEPTRTSVPVVEPNPEEKKPEAGGEQKTESPEKAGQERVEKEPSMAASRPSTAQNAASEFPLADTKVLAELKALEARAREAAKSIEILKEQLAASAKKDVLTKDDIIMMEQKQTELMDKMQEFEDITKKVQQLVGLVDVASSQLGPPQKPMVPPVEGGKPEGPSKQSKSAPPNETLPKVIICGTQELDEVPKIIVCEPTSVRNGRQPLYHQIKNDTTTGKDKDPSKTKFAPPPSNQQPYMGQGYPCYPGGPMRPFGDGSHMGMMQPGMAQAGMMQPGMGQAGMMYPGMGRTGMMQSGMGQPNMMQPGMGQPNMMQPGMGQSGMMLPGMGQSGMMQPGMGQNGMMPPGMGQGGMMQPGMGQPNMMQPGMGPPNMMQPWMAQPGMMQYGPMQPGMTQFGMVPQGMGQPSAAVMPGICCNQCGRPKKQKSQKTNEEDAGPGQKSKPDESDNKKSSRKRKQCYCQISGLCQLNKTPYPTT